MTLNYNSLVGQVPKLTKDNYYDWKFSISLVLQRAGCWDIIQKGKNKSEDWKIPKNAQNKADEALTIIGLTINPSQYKLISHCKNGVEAWYKLAGHYEKNSRANRIQLTCAFYNFKHDPKMLISDYINGLEMIWNQMHGIGMNVDDSDLADALIMCLNPRFNAISASLTSHANEPSSEEVMDILRDEEARMEMNGEKGPSPGAFIAGGKRAKVRAKCWNCHQEGHYQHNC